MFKEKNETKKNEWQRRSFWRWRYDNVEPGWSSFIDVFVFRIFNVDNDKPDDDREGYPKNSNHDVDEQLPINNVNNPEEGSIIFPRTLYLPLLSILTTVFSFEYFVFNETLNDIL